MTKTGSVILALVLSAAPSQSQALPQSRLVCEVPVRKILLSG